MPKLILAFELSTMGGGIHNKTQCPHNGKNISHFASKNCQSRAITYPNMAFENPSANGNDGTGEDSTRLTEHASQIEITSTHIMNVYYFHVFTWYCSCFRSMLRLKKICFITFGTPRILMLSI